MAVNFQPCEITKLPVAGCRVMLFEKPCANAGFSVQCSYEISNRQFLIDFAKADNFI
jgi:hypothetical protein